MKSLSLNKPLVLIVVGLPGSGKSFFARQFSDTFHAPLVSQDEIRHVLYSEPTLTKQEQNIVDSMCLLQARELFKTHKTFIVDGHASTKSKRANLRKMAKDKDFDTLLVWVQTDVATAKYRSMKRSNRKKDDTFNQSLSGMQYEELARSFSPPTGQEPTIVISGKHTYATQARVVLKKLVAPRANAPQTIVNHSGRTPQGPSAARRNVIIR